VFNAGRISALRIRQLLEDLGLSSLVQVVFEVHWCGTVNVVDVNVVDNVMIITDHSSNDHELRQSVRVERPGVE
jgi:hypothetical protein